MGQQMLYIKASSTCPAISLAVNKFKHVLPLAEGMQFCCT